MRKSFSRISILSSSAATGNLNTRRAASGGVDEYVLKPVSISKMTSILQTIQGKLDSEQQEQAAAILPAIACRQPYDEAAAVKLYARRGWFSPMCYGAT